MINTPMANMIRVGIARENRAGYVIRKKTAEEIREDLRQFDLKHGIDPTAPKRVNKTNRGRGRSYTDAQRKALIDVVHGHLNAGDAAKEAVKKAGVSYKLYLYWRNRYGITEPALLGRWKEGDKR